MGYTHQHTQLLIGLGVSSISDSWYGFAQNVKTVKEYLALTGAGEFAVMKGHLLSGEDLLLRRHILDIMCKGQALWTCHEKPCKAVIDGLVRLKALEDGGLIELSSSGLKVTVLGKRFLRNICLCLDASLGRLNRPRNYSAWPFSRQIVPEALRRWDLSQVRRP